MEDMEIRDLAAVSLYALGYKNHNTWSARVPSGFFVGVEGGERPVFVDEYASRYHVSTATPALDGVNGLTNISVTVFRLITTLPSITPRQI